MTKMLANVISMSFLVAFAIPAAGAVVGDAHAGALLAALFLANAAVAGIKATLGGSTRADSWLGRPAGASGCDVFCIGGPVDGQPGMPSGHVTTATLFVTYMWLHHRSVWILAVGIPWCVAMAWARWQKRCHSVPQVVAGFLFGVGAAYVSHMAVSHMLK